MLTLREHLSSPTFFWWGPCCSSFLVFFSFFFRFCVVLLCVFTLWVPCCDIRYDFRIKTLFVSSLRVAFCRMSHVLFTLFVFEYDGVQHTVLFFFVWCNICCQFPWVVFHFVLPLPYSLTFIYWDSFCSICVLFRRSLFVFYFFWPLYCLSFIFWPLYCLSFDLRRLVSWNISFQRAFFLHRNLEHYVE